MRMLTFEQITDSRFDTNIEQLLMERVDKISTLLSNYDGVNVMYDNIRKVTFNNDIQYRCRFYVTKTTRKITWNDIYKIVNSVKAVPYNFI